MNHIFMSYILIHTHVFNWGTTKYIMSGFQKKKEKKRQKKGTHNGAGDWCLVTTLCWAILKPNPACKPQTTSKMYPLLSTKQKNTTKGQNT